MHFIPLLPQKTPKFVWRPSSSRTR